MNILNHKRVQHRWGVPLLLFKENSSPLEIEFQQWCLDCDAKEVIGIEHPRFLEAINHILPPGCSYATLLKDPPIITVHYVNGWATSHGLDLSLYMHWLDWEKTGEEAWIDKANKEAKHGS